MPGENITANSHQEYWNKLQAYHTENNADFKEISKAEYEKINLSEREDSDNHFNQSSLGKITNVSDITFYKYLPENKVAYRTHIIDVNGNEEVKYYTLRTLINK